MNTKRLLVVTLVLCFGVGVAAHAGATAGQAAETACESPSAEQIVKEMLDTMDAVGGPPDCPAERSNCNDNSNLFCGEGDRCSLTGDVQSVDTGLGKCRLAGGGLLNCPKGETVYVTTGTCSKCPCCFASPPDQCFCPSTCPQFVRVTCGAFGGIGSE